MKGKWWRDRFSHSPAKKVCSPQAQETLLTGSIHASLDRDSTMGFPVQEKICVL